MKYKALLVGRNQMVIDDFFVHLDEDFESLTASLRYKDILGHIKWYEPDALVFCMHNEEKESIRTIMSLRDKLENYNIPLIIIANQIEADEFQRESYRMAKLVLIKPISGRNVRDKIVSFLESWYRPKETVLSQVVNENIREAEASIPVRKHILVVDDDPMMLKLIKEHLKDTYAVGTAINGGIALKFLEKKKTDLIILDYEMPGENGAKVLEKIRANEATANVPVIFLTGISDKEKIQKVLTLRPQGYLLKPIEREQLLAVISKTLA